MARWHEPEAHECGGCGDTFYTIDYLYSDEDISTCWACGIKLCPDCVADVDGEDYCETCAAGLEEVAEVAEVAAKSAA